MGIGEELEEVIENNEHVVDRFRDSIQGMVIADGRGTVVRTQYDATYSTTMINLFGKALSELARSAIRDIDPTNDLKFLRVKTKKHELLIAPEEEFIICVGLHVK